MASNLKRSKRTIGRRISSLESRTRRLQKLPTRTRLGPRAVVGSSIAQGAITTSELSPVVTNTITSAETAATTAQTAATTAQTTADDAFTAADDAQTAADTAQATADGKNKIYRSDAEPPVGGTYVDGDLWFETDQNNKIHRRLGGAWVAVQLGGEALANINANKITAGTIDANVITVSNIDAGNITAGVITSARINSASISAAEINADKITGGTLTGRVIQNSLTTPNFKVDTNGDVFANNIFATGSVGGTQPGLIIRSDGVGGAPASAGGSLYLFSGVGTISENTSQYKVRIGSSARYLEISYPRNPLTGTGQREHVNVETTVSTQHLRLSSASGQIGLLGNTQTQRTQNAVTVAGDIILENYGPDADTDDGNAPAGSRTVFSKNIGNSSSSTYCRIGLIDGLQYYGDPSSLRELKDNIEDITGEESINLIKKLRPRKYTWKPEENDSELQKALKSLDIHYGFVAEEVQEADRALATYKMTPEFQQQWPNVTEEMFNDFPLIFYKEGAMPSITISAVKNLIERVEYLESRI